MRTLLLFAALAAGCAGSGLGENVRKDVSARMDSTRETIAACYETALKHKRKLRPDLMTDAATKDKVKEYFIDAVHVQPKSYEDVRRRLIDFAAKLERKYKTGKLMLDLDLEPVLATRPRSDKP